MFLCGFFLVISYRNPPFVKVSNPVYLREVDIMRMRPRKRLKCIAESCIQIIAGIYNSRKETERWIVLDELASSGDGKILVLMFQPAQRYKDWMHVIRFHMPHTSGFSGL